MKKKNILKSSLALFLFFSISISFQLKAEEVQFADVKKVAFNAFSHFSGKTINELDIVQVIPFKNNDTTAFYVINFEESFIIISSDDIVEPVIGYGLHSSLAFNDIPPALDFLLESYKEEIMNAKRLRTNATQKIHDNWNYYINYEPDRGGLQQEEGFLQEINISPFSLYKPGTYLIETKWNQYGGYLNGSDITYNYYCPTNNQGRKTIVGCGGVSVAQILNYWKCRVHPQDTIKYLPPGLDSININMNVQTYNWFNMLPNHANLENAKLLYHCAAAIESEFGWNSTGSYTSKTEIGFKNNFGFSAAISYNKNFYSGSWVDLLKTDINNYRPVFYRGTDPSRGGHAWVVDGYNSSNHFHCNWGWGGSSDGWFNLSNLTGYVAFTTNQAAITNIYPTHYPCTIFQNIIFSSKTYTGHNIKVAECGVQNNANVIFEVECMMEIFGPFEVPLGATFEVK